MDERKIHQKHINPAIKAGGFGASEDIFHWKEYLKAKGLYHGDVTSDRQDDAFKIAMQSLESRVTSEVPAAIGMIWRKGQINPMATIADVEESLQLLSYKIDEPPPLVSVAETDLRAALEKIKKMGVADFDSLGPPTDPEFIGTPFKQMFISQEDSKANETDPSKNQNQGTWQNPAPKSVENIEEKPKPKGSFDNIDDRMSRLVDLIDAIEKKDTDV